MNPERWQQIKGLLQSALDREPGERAAFLDEACAANPSLRREVESLIASHEQAGGFIESPAVEFMADSLEDPTDSLAGQSFGPYQITGRIGIGGMGEVYLAHDSRLGRKVALKMLPDYFTRDDERVRRFQQEARAASALNHPNILTIYEIGQIDSRHFIATEFIEGDTLRDRMARTQMKIGEVLEVATQVAWALSAAHQAGIAHRDIKPGNIMLRPDGVVKVLDFGLAKLTEKKADDLEAATLLNTKQGMVMGTAHYMSPEQARGLKVDVRSDIFSLGVVLYEMVTGRVPFAGPTMTDVLASILMLEPPSLSQSAPEAPDELQRIVHRALRKDKEERYQTSGELLTDLKALKKRIEFEVELGRANESRGYSSTEHQRQQIESRGIESLAVLPLIDASADANMEYFSDGVTESIINSLSQLPNLRVVARSTVFRYKGTEVDPQKVGQQLGVRAVLTGRVRQAGDELMIAAELIDITNDAQLWGEHYNRKLSDVFAVQEEIANEITEKLRLKLSGEDRRRLAKHFTEDPKAYHAYLKGRYYWNKRSTAELQKAIEHFRQAIDLDPGYAAAYAGLSDSYTLLVVREAMAPQEGFAKAKAAAAKALEIDPDLSEAHASLGHALLHNWEWEAAEKELKRAIALNPGYPSAHHWYSEHLTAMGRFDESVKELGLAGELDPLSLVINADLGRAFYFARQYDKTIGQEKKTLEMDANFWLSHINLGRSYTQKEKYADAISELQTASELSPGNTESLSYLAFAYAAAGDRDKARQMLGDLEQKAKQGYVPPYHLAIIHAGLRQKDEAFAWLERAYEARAVDFFTLNVEPMFDQLRSEARFTDLIRRIGLTPASVRPRTPGPDVQSQSSLETVSSKRTRSRFAESGAIESLAVLPLTNASADPDMEYFSDGVTESIINALSQLPNLRVVARSTVFRYKGREVDPQDIGQQLGVRAVLTGRVRQAGNGLMIAAELIDVANDSQLWGEHYTRELSDIFAVQEEIAKEISEKLRLKLTPAERDRLTKRPTENPEAYQLYLKGRFFWNKRTEEGLRQSVEYFQQAIEKDPDYAAAYAGISDCYTILVARHGMSSAEGLRRAQAAAIKALELDETLAEAHTALAHARLHDWEWAEAEQGIGRALALNPADAAAHNVFGEYLLAVERIDEAIVEIKKAQKLDPLSLIITSVAAWTFYFARQYDQAIEESRKSLELDPDFFWARYRLGQAYERKGMFEEAIAELQKARQLSRGNKEISAALAHAYAVSGSREEAQNIMNELRQTSERGRCSPYDIALIHVGLGENDQALQFLEKAYEDRDSKIIHLKVDPRLDGLHSDRRFTDLVRRLGFPEQNEFVAKSGTLTPASESIRSSVPLEQEIRFCTTGDGVRIAYATVGDGPPLVKAANWLNHLEFDWQSPIWKHVVEEFARDHLLVRYDERGNGLSDWDVENFSFESFVQDLETVVDSLRLDRFPILGISQGGPVAIAYAVRHPEKVSHLILYGSYARGWAKRGMPEDVERREAQNKLIKLGWGQDNPAFRQLWSTQYVPDGSMEQWRWFNDLHRICISPDNAVRLEYELGQIDVVDLLSQVKVPTLVLHCRDELQVPFEEGRLLAAKIPGARFVPLEGRNHLLLESEPAWPKFVMEVRRFLKFESGRTTLKRHLDG